MKRLLIVLMTTLMITMLCACSVTKTENTEDDMNITDDETEPEVELVTKERIMEYFDFSEEELEGIDVDAVIKQKNLTEEKIKNCSSRESCLEYLKIFDEEIKTYIGYLFKGGQPEEKIPVSQIKTVAFFESQNELQFYWHICVKEKKAYFFIGYSEHTDLEKECEYSVTLTDEHIEELLNCLDNANLHKWKWKDYYVGEDDDSTSSWGWNLGIELTDGTVYSWSGDIVSTTNQPGYQSIYDVITAI